MSAITVCLLLGPIAECSFCTAQPQVRRFDFLARRRERIRRSRTLYSREGNFDEPQTMVAFDKALKLNNIAPQWRVPSGQLAGEQALPHLLEDELALLAEVEEPPLQLSELEHSLLERSLKSLNYLGDWANPNNVQDSIVLTCNDPTVLLQEDGMNKEYTCSYNGFQAERHQLHAHIVERMLTSHRTTGRRTQRSDLEAGHQGEPPAQPQDLGEGQHVFFVVGVPGSGKDTILKRYLRSLDLELLDASADLVKEYLAAWGQDELSQMVRSNNNERGPGKHLLHAQYLHRESIMIVDKILERALAQNRSVILEKTMYNIEPVLRQAQQFKARGCRVHLYGTHIAPLKNWEFLSYRMRSGQAFGRYIERRQVITGLRNYQRNLEDLISDRELNAIFDSVHVFDVMSDRWCISFANSGKSDDASVDLAPSITRGAVGAETSPPS